MSKNQKNRCGETCLIDLGSGRAFLESFVVFFKCESESFLKIDMKTFRESKKGEIDVSDFIFYFRTRLGLPGSIICHFEDFFGDFTHLGNQIKRAKLSGACKIIFF